MRPADQYRSRYQLRLDESRALIASGCAAPDETDGGGQPSPGGEPPPSSGNPDLQLIPDSVLPALRVSARTHQPTRRADALTAVAACANEDCYVRARATVAVPGRGLFRLAAPLRKLVKAKRETLKLALTKRLRTAIASSKRGCPRGVIRVVAANAAGWRISASRSVLLCS
jgi:hypothetical protein